MSGFSLGANIVSKYVGEEGPQCPLSGVVVLANPWNFARGSVHIEEGSLANRFVYRFVMGSALQTLYNLHKNTFFSSPSDSFTVGHEGLRKALGIKKLSLKQVDELLSAPLFGFKDAMTYYGTISSSNVIDKVSIPMLGLNARDDPILGDVSLPVDEVWSHISIAVVTVR